MKLTVRRKRKTLDQLLCLRQLIIDFDLTLNMPKETVWNRLGLLKKNKSSGS